MATLADVLKAIKELITVTEKIRDNTDEIVKLEEEVRGLKGEMHGLKEEFRAFREESRLSDSELRGDLKAILNRLDTALSSIICNRRQAHLNSGVVRSSRKNSCIYWETGSIIETPRS